jgi:hypothetical protein
MCTCTFFSQRPSSMEDEGTEHMEALQAALQDGKSCLSCWS